MAAAEGDDADVFGYHYENGMLAVNLFHMRGGKMVDRREFFWEDLPEFGTAPDHVEEKNHVGTGALARPGEQSSPAHLADGSAESEDSSRASLGSDGRGPPSPH